MAFTELKLVRLCWKIMSDIKITYDEGHDVEMTKRGFMNVKIKQEFDGNRLEYDTTFVSQSITKQIFNDHLHDTFGVNDE